MGVGVLRDGGFGVAYVQVAAVQQRTVVERDVLQRVVKVAARVDGTSEVVVTADDWMNPACSAIQ